jgi:hypothetical protein
VLRGYAATREQPSDDVGSDPVETAVVFLVVFALGFAVGYGVRARVSRNRCRRYAERNQY